MGTVAITRRPGPSMEGCELTHLAREPIDVARVAEQHERYSALLAELGCRVVELPPEPDCPDAVFVEDTAVVLDELAVLTRPGAASRRVEVPSIGRALAPYRECVAVEAPGTLDGGDVLRLGRRLFVGEATRSNAAGAERLRTLVEPHGYTVETVPIRGCLHLKSAACALGDDLVLVQESWVDPTAFGEVEVLLTDPAEEGAANVVRLDGGLIHPEGFPRTSARLEAAGLAVHTLPYDELQKAEGAVTCCSLLLEG